MKKFRFKFDMILKARKAREDEALRALGEAQQAYQAELGRRARLSRELQSALLRREKLAEGRLEILALRTEQDYIDGTKAWIARADQAIARASRSVERALRVYLHARRQTRMMELLYEKHFQEFKKERARREQKELDDLSVMRSRMRLEDAEEEIA